VPHESPSPSLIRDVETECSLTTPAHPRKLPLSNFTGRPWPNRCHYPDKEEHVSETTTYALNESVATITLDDGKVNALSLRLFEEINAALDQAVSDKAVVVLSGRPGIFSAGFDLKVLRGGGPDAVPMLQEGFKLAERMLSFPTPILVACPGHAVAMGVFLLLSADYRIGVRGPYRITANEVAIGLTMPRAAIEISRQRLAPAQFSRAVVLADVFTPEEAVSAGFFDQIVDPPELDEAISKAAQRAVTLDMSAHYATKQRARAKILRELRAAIELDDTELLGAIDLTSP
jgi:enoyl-CoA hydratase